MNYFFLRFHQTFKLYFKFPFLILPGEATTPGKNMELAHLEDVHPGFFYLTVNKLTADKTTYFFFIRYSLNKLNYSNYWYSQTIKIFGNNLEILYLHLFAQTIDIMIRVFINGLGDWGSIPG